MKIGRNSPCPCESGKKHKHCCGRLGPVQSAFPASAFARAQTRHEADELIRTQQQGLGRPIISTDLKRHKIVAVRDRVFWSDKWKTFPDFLSDYIKTVLDPAWGNAEIAKPLAERHVIMQWYDAYCRYQQGQARHNDGAVFSGDMIGVAACYLGLAYALYLIEHNVELQGRLVARLKNTENFQGAYYELIVASILIRAGFDLVLEDEADRASKHCEFAAVSKRTGKRYWVEAKMRSVSGILGKSDADGTKDTNPLGRMIKHLNAAFAKPAAHGRLIFIDLNTPVPADASQENAPAYLESANRRLLQFERENPDKAAYVFVTAMPFHLDLLAPAVLAASPLGIGMPDFNRPGMARLVDRWRQEQKHLDAFDIAESCSHYLRIPSTFDGGLPSESFGRQSNRIIIGETYAFETGVATVSTACVSEPEKAIYVGTTDGLLLRQPMTDADLADYRAHPEGYFGRVQSPNRKVNHPYELFQFFMDSYGNLAREEILQRFANSPELPRLEQLELSELRAEYCDAMVWASGMFKPMANPVGPTPRS
jgi:hypothetical protein